MGITPLFKQEDVLKQLNLGKEMIEDQILRVLKFVGEEFAKNARARVTETIYERTVYDKHGNARERQPWELTGNLRSSIGYFVLKNGEVIDQKFQDNPAGKEAAEKLLNKIPNKDGLQLIGVAGMDYASYVESRGFDVITTSGDIAIVSLKRKIKQFQDMLNRRGAQVNFNLSNAVGTII